jgi:RND superfamily putative drug exporter
VRLSTERLARACARRPWVTVAAWLLAVVLSMGVVAALLGSVLTSEGEVTSNPESEQGYAAMGRHFPPDPSAEYVNEFVLIRSPTLSVDDPPFRRKVDGVLADVRSSGVVHNVRSYYEDDDASLVSSSRRATVLPLGVQGDCEEGAGRLVGIVQAADSGAFDVRITGECTVDRDITQILDHDLKTGELYFGIPAALLILVLVFGALVAAVLPLVLAISAIVVALGLSALVGQAFDLSVYLVNMLTVMGLAIGTDYALFIVSRYREERSGGRPKLEAIATTGGTASRAVLFSGGAFVLAMSGLLLIPDTVLRSLGVGAITVALVSVVAALTLMPAVLSLLGDRVNALRVPVLGRSVETAGREGRFWSAIARAVMHRPVVSLVATVAVLLAAAAPALDLRLSTAGVRSLPDGVPSKEGFLALEQEFGVGTSDSMQVVVEGDVAAPTVRTAIRRFTRRLRANPLFREPEVDTSPDRRLAVVEALVVGDSRDRRAIEAVERVRSEDVPAAFGAVPASVFVTGETAEEIDYRELTDRWLPRILVFVLALSFVLLTIAFRSIVLPLKAILLNLLSVGAAYGLMVLVFQKGVGNELFGLRRVEAVTPWAPLFLFSVLFGLSMDYHVFLLSRIRERFLATGDNNRAIAWAVGSTARVITGAALIIIVVFAGFASGDLVETQQIGFGVAVALLIDATLVRSVLVPASMTLLGPWNWYLPRWLGWLPDLHVEHEAA